MSWLGCIPPRREEGPALGVSTPQVCIRVVPGKQELLLLLIMYLLNIVVGPVDSVPLHVVNIHLAKLPCLSNT